MSSILGLIPAFAAARIIDSAIPKGSLKEILLYAGAIVAASLVSMGVTIVQGYYTSTVGQSVMRDIRTSLVARLYRMPVAFFGETKAGEVMNRILGDVDNIEGILTNTLTMIVTSF
ncbi:MAG: ABC transporter transmembrane domain-containing protein, partial [Candidatus Eremiobacteraeota bacterium]|nr:ABC transporter transmembrane domain-containing protein [Candidatus Eremiobacteraeota bacterium]